MPCHGNANKTRPAIIKTTRKNNNNVKKQKQKFHGKSQYLNLKAPSNNVKLQSDIAQTTQMYTFLTTHYMEFFFKETRKQVDKKKK